MPSEKACYVIEMMKKVKSMPKTEEPVDYARRRAFVEKRHAGQAVAGGVDFTEMNLNGVEAVCCVPDQGKKQGAILYIHGGGFLTGSAYSSKGYASFLAKSSGLQTYCISYRLAPENPYPAALDDCLAAYKALSESRPEEKIALVGGSAGGNLCLATALRARAEKVSMPAALALFSPVTEQSGELPSRRTNAGRDCSIDPDIDRETQKTYILKQDFRHPYISPLYGDFSGFPPMLIIVDGSEVLLDDSVLLAVHARAAGAETELHVTDGLFHDFPSVGPELPEAAEAMEKVVALLRRCGM